MPPGICRDVASSFCQLALPYTPTNCGSGASRAAAHAAAETMASPLSLTCWIAWTSMGSAGAAADACVAAAAAPSTTASG